MRQSAPLVFKVGFRPWVWAYLASVYVTARLTGRMPDRDKVRHWVGKAAVLKQVKHMRIEA